MPRLRLIYHGAVRGEPVWGAPLDDPSACPHPRPALRFYPDSLPMRVYCRICGTGNLHPFHGLTDEEIEAARERGREMHERLGGE